MLVLPNLRFNWNKPDTFRALEFVCCHCGRLVSSDGGYSGIEETNNLHQIRIFICPNCRLPNTFRGSVSPGDPTFRWTERSPSPPFGEKILDLPPDINTVYEEARRCITVDAFSAAVMLCRKLLMHIAVERGDAAGKSYQAYVD